jgi:hypothetical protein
MGYIPIRSFLMDKVKINFNMFSANMEHKIRSKSTVIITLNRGVVGEEIWSSLRSKQIQ